ncbi:MAG: class I SAM-dependent methyltransferase [Nocardioidaceae bacterium]|nr:class I SAM-dependent methyltransferase [Nocardioidaceae bacterium]
MRLWSDHVVPRLADAALKGKEVGELRGLACAPLTGRVLELGFGGGLNVRWYPPAVTEVVAVEPSDVGWSISTKRRGRTELPILRHHLDGQRLAEPDRAYDAVLSTFTLCTIPDVRLALQEARRVLKDDGVFVFLEHGLAPTPRMAAWQRRLDPIQRTVGGGCNLSRDIPALVAEEFEVRVDHEGYLANKSPLTYLYRGVGAK